MITSRSAGTAARDADTNKGAKAVASGGSADAVAPDSPIEAQLFGSVSGTVLEIGPGYGALFDFLPADIDWIGLEPNKRARAELAASGVRSVRSSTLIAGVAEQIPLADGSVDAVISSLVLCSVDDQDRALDEIRRVLRPGGRFVFFEHVAGPRGSLLRAGQRTVAFVVAHGTGACHPDRDTREAIERHFGNVGVDTHRLAGPFGIGIPHIAGTAYA